MHALLYAQVLQVDGQSWRNVLILRAEGSTLSPQGPANEGLNLLPAFAQFAQPDIVAILGSLGLPLDCPLGVVALEMLPPSGPQNGGQLPPPPALSPVGTGLGQVRILRTSALTPVPAICPPKVPIM